MRNIKVSIVTVCYNSEKTIQRTIESVLNQTYKNIEYIIIDGKSTDHTIDIIKKYIPMAHGRLKYISERDKGIYNAFNKGLRMTTGKIIGIINSDDFYELDAVQRVIDHMNDSPCQVIYGYCNVISRCGISTVKTSHIDLTKRSMIPHPACFVTRESYCRYGMFIEGIKIASDYELMMRFYKTQSVVFTQIPHILANFTTMGISSSKESASLLEIEYSAIYYKYNLIPFKEFLEILLLNKFSKKYKKVRELSNNHLILLRLMERWVEVKQHEKSIAEILRKKKYYNIAVYGMSYVGKRLVRELEGSDINISYGIDQRTDLYCKGIEIVTADSDLKNVDAIIVTAVYYFDDIENVLSKKVKCPIISMEELLYDMSFESDDFMEKG